MTDTVTLYRPGGPEELAKIEATGMTRFPPRLPEQPIFTPVLTEAYAAKIARDWNVPKSGTGFVTRFEVRKAVADAYEPQEAGAGRTRNSGRLPKTSLPWATRSSARSRS